MDIDLTFLPVAEQLIDVTFPTAIVYHRPGASTYDPLTGVVASTSADHSIKAGVLSRNRVEGGGVSETYDISIWVHHGAAGLPFLPVTGDSFTYDAMVWKVIEVSPTYSSKALIASKIKARAA